jgi:very-short-patch-repair endonuclease
MPNQQPPRRLPHPLERFALTPSDHHAASDLPVAVQSAMKTWSDQLYNLGGNNNLLRARELTAGTLNLDAAETTAKQRLLSGRSVTLASLFPDDEKFGRAAKRAKTIFKKVKEMQEERGIDVGYLAIGTVTWPVSKGVPPNAPLLLRELDFVDPPARSGDCKLRLAEFSDMNPALLRALNAEFGLSLRDEAFADLLGDGGEAPFDQVADRLQTLCGSAVELEFGQRFLAGTFSFAKLPMVRDIESAGALLAKSAMVRAICGDTDAQHKVRGEVTEPGLYQVPRPADEFLVFDSDSSQSRAIDAIVDGTNLVVDGPPGTGKSQTIANLIATLTARGRKVLFVAEKRAAIDAVLSRIGRVGLSGLVMDIHGGASDRRAVAAELASALASAKQASAVSTERLHRSLADDRAALDEHAASMHRRRAPWDVSLFDSQTRLIALAESETAHRFTGDALRLLAGSRLDQIRGALRRFTDLGGLDHRRQGQWLGAAVHTSADLDRVLDLVHSLHTELLPDAGEAMDKVRYQCGFRTPVDLEDWAKALKLFAEAKRSLEILRPEAYRADLRQLAAACATRRWRKKHGIDLPSGERRSLVKQSKSLTREKLSNGQRHSTFEYAAALQSEWHAWQHEQSPLELPDGLAAAADTFAALRQAVDELDRFILSTRLSQSRIDLLREAVAALAADNETPYRLVELHGLRRDLNAAGCARLLDGLVDRGMDSGQVLRAFDYAWHASLLDHARRTDPVFGAFSGTAMNSTVESFREHDVEHLRSNAKRVQRLHAERLYRAMSAKGMAAQETLIKGQANRKRGHKPVRDLLAEAGDLLLELKPVWAMSPLVVSQLLPQRRMFDVVIFDEASQIPTADAIPSIMRAAQTVVAGDPRQLPPSNFFRQMEHDEGETENDLSMASGYESVLDALQPLLPRCSLTWHYRSRNERLIAFSNTWIYDRSLTTFPGATESEAVTHVLAEGPTITGDDQSSTEEVRRVVELVAAHAASRPQESLGVIAMGSKHADRIDAALTDARYQDPVLDGFLGKESEEPFFVKNLERVQGDERDAIILSIGYCKGANGRMSHRFGPINRDGGERRLNVAVTRAKQRMTVVSAFSHRDLDPNKLTKAGPQQLRAYLEFAESGGTMPGSVLDEHPELNPFEIDVRDRLEAAGIPLVAQYGAAGFRIDFAAAHPERPGEMVLAIEADGATYHSSVSARDRDRLRQQQLENLGWTFHRIWSTDWFRDPETQVQRARDAYDRAVRQNDEQRAAAPKADRVVAEAPAAPSAVAAAPSRNLPKPRIRSGAPITEYSTGELVRIVQWVLSDTLLRTDEELLRETAKEMGYRKVGPRIRTDLGAAIRRARR